jgi:Carboxypeptidase regulatory-like domain/TonB-dependent Receptor Plug Domain
MRPVARSILFCILVVGSCPIFSSLQAAQSNAGSINGTVSDPSGAVIPGASVSIKNPVSAYSRTTTTDDSGQFHFSNVPFNHYHLTASRDGFATYATDVNVQSVVAVTTNIHLQIGAASNTITVEGGEDLIEGDPTAHTDIDRGLFDRLPLENASSSLSSLVTLASPGVSADSNGLFHGLGDHASNSFSVDGQPITDQQSKVFSNQLPSNAVQSLEVIDGAPPAEYGGKTSLVINVTTRSGMGMAKPVGNITSSYGSFGTATGSIDLGYGGKNWGNFLEFDGLNTGRFLDPPEFKVFHAKGNEQNVFDRVDYQFTDRDSIHVNLNYSRSWFQNPNSYDQLNVSNVASGGTGPSSVFENVGNADQRSKIGTYNIAPTYTRIINTNSVLNFGGFVRRDGYNYYPSANPLADLGPIQGESVDQQRSLLNTGAHAELTLHQGINDVKAGAVYQHTFLREHDNFGLVDPTFNSPCVDADGNPQPGFTNPGQCGTAGLLSNDPSLGGTFNPELLPYDLTRSGSFYRYFGHTVVKELALYVQDQIKAGNWIVNLGMRGDFYNGLAITRQPEPRVGLAYNVKKTNTVLRASYARTLETPFNENLVLSSQGCLNDVLAPLLSCTPGVSGTLQPGFRNEFHAGLQQAFGKNFVISGDYIWKYTHNAFDFSVFGNTPIFFPIDWHNSKIPGFTLRADVPNFHHVSAFVVMSSVAARFFPPQVSGAGATVGQAGLPFRIDHDEKFNQTTHVQYQVPGRIAPWIGFNWRYDSGQVAGSTPCFNVTGANTHCGDTSTTINGQPAIDLSGLTADQEFQAGFACNGVRATPTSPLPTPCLASQFTSSLINIPAPNTEDDDKNPARMVPRSLFDASIGADNLFNGDKRKWSLRLTAVNVGNNYALYNFLSTFSGTHYVTPRAMTAELGFHF